MKVFMIAGEPSGDRLGAALMVGLRDLMPGVSFDGVGGVEMTEQGLRSRFEMSDLSVMGLAEVLPRARMLLARVRQTAAIIIATRPDLVITIDSPDFCLRVLRGARKARPDLATVHYVAPSVWAWRPGRAARMAPLVDHVLALLPFEPPYMQAAGMSCDFVGHPVTTETRATDAEARAFRASHDIPETAPVLLALPGSRRGEISRLAPRFGRALSLVVAQHPDLRVLVPTVTAQEALVREIAATWPGQAKVIAGSDRAGKRASFRAAGLAFAASGTVSLGLAANATPMVIAYDLNPLTRFIVSRLIRVQTATLVNLVSQTTAIPEFLGRACQPGPIAEAVLKLLNDPLAREAQLDAMARTMTLLGAEGPAPGLRAAQSVLDFMATRAGQGAGSSKG